MVSTRLMALALVVVWGCSMTASEENWKWYKPYTWMSSAKSYSPSSHHPAVYGKPLPRPYISPGHDKHRDRCELRKVVFTQDAESPQVSESRRSGSMFLDERVFIYYRDFNAFRSIYARLTSITRFLIIGTQLVSSTLFLFLLFQYIVYKTKIPDLKEFTLCHWHNIFNYTHDQPIFSYSRKYIILHQL